MTAEIIAHLTFVDASIKPTEPGEYLIFNQCDGFHVVEASFDHDDGEFLGFRPFAQDLLPPGFYCAWACVDRRIGGWLFDAFARAPRT